ncbi:aldehyde dehydrogenase family protein [Pelobacter propionicus]|uniref:Aldehyde dehydrogenase n=1 Tax=Pelobacter propionicus (strain DSM 2379 / NBRC 103807 / OttBd1) TaxID=338966 RepID=A1ARI9_PELPD|nr:aldehyde dehydrogenase family protein [Pelobacter propionicus]ABK99959.1 aldehyde dehydrogenase [Pelobacter propionicus DSM 2379]
MHEYDKLYINGQWAASSDPSFIQVVGAASEEVIGRVPSATVNDVDRAVAAARAAFDAWSATSPAERAECLTKLHQGLVERSEEIARIVTAEVGMPLKFSLRIQAGLPVAVMGSYASLAAEQREDERIANSLIVREPVGVVACITPWNYPLHQIVAKVAPALAAGCCVVVKPSSEAPLSSFILAEIVEKAGLPPGVFNLVSGRGATIGEALASHPDVDMVSFTGSTSVGRRLSVLAAGTVKKVALELGGKSASVILDDADLPAAVKGSLGACLLNSGQTCSAHTRLLVPESLYEQAVSLAVELGKSFVPSDPFGDKCRLGPLVSASQRERVWEYIRSGIAEGAELLLGGVEPPAGLTKGFYVSPTIFGRVRAEMTIAQEEIFGPVLCIIPYSDEEVAFRIANSSIYGLAGGVWSADEGRALAFARRMRTGQVDINGAPFNILAPFGGYRQSGNGRELGRYGLEEFQEIKSIQLKG